MDFEVARYDEGWGSYCYCAWVLKHRFASVADAASAAERYFDDDGVSYLSLEWLIFGDEEYSEELPDGRPLYLFDPELRIYDNIAGESVDEYLLSGGYGAVVVQKVSSKSFSRAAG